MKSSIRTQIMTAFIVILTLTMVLCIGLNNGLLKDFYYQKKQEKVVHYYQKLDQLTNNKSENDSKVSAVLISMRDADNISFIQTTSDWSLDEVSANCVSNMQASELRHRLMQYILVWDRMDTVTTLKQGERYKILKYYDPIEGTSYMDFKQWNLLFNVYAVRSCAGQCTDFQSIFHVHLLRRNAACTYCHQCDI